MAEKATKDKLQNTTVIEALKTLKKPVNETYQKI